MPDEEFVKAETLLKVIRFCCVVGYLKGVGIEATISDRGVIHELIHLATGTANRPLREIREQLSKVMALAERGAKDPWPQRTLLETDTWPQESSSGDSRRSSPICKPKTPKSPNSGASDSIYTRQI